MKTETIVMCVVLFLVGMLLANMLTNVCGCKVVEGQEHVPEEDYRCSPNSDNIIANCVDGDATCPSCYIKDGGERGKEPHIIGKYCSSNKDGWPCAAEQTTGSVQWKFGMCQLNGDTGLYECVEGEDDGWDNINWGNVESKGVDEDRSPRNTPIHVDHHEGRLGRRHGASLSNLVNRHSHRSR